MARAKTSGAGGFERRLSMPLEAVVIAHMKGNPAMAAEIIDLAAVRNARLAKVEPAPIKPEPPPEPTPEQRAAWAQDYLDLFLPVGSVPMKPRRKPRTPS